MKKIKANNALFVLLPALLFIASMLAKPVDARFISPLSNYDERPFISFYGSGAAHLVAQGEEDDTDESTTDSGGSLYFIIDPNGLDKTRIFGGLNFSSQESSLDSSNFEPELLVFPETDNLSFMIGVEHVFNKHRINSIHSKYKDKDLFGHWSIFTHVNFHTHSVFKEKVEEGENEENDKDTTNFTIVTLNLGGEYTFQFSDKVRFSSNLFFTLFKPFDNTEDDFRKALNMDDTSNMYPGFGAGFILQINDAFFEAVYKHIGIETKSIDGLTGSRLMIRMGVIANVFDI